MSEIAKASFRLNTIKPIESVKGSATRAQVVGTELSITPADLQKLVSLITELERKDRSDRKYCAKRCK